MKSTSVIRISAKVLENVLTPEKPMFKERGSTEFEIEIDSMMAYRADEASLVKSIKDLLKETSGDQNRFEYISHKVLFGAAPRLDSDRFTQILNS
jgi:hypothetical protein